jgi:hypothetical protein
MQPQDKCRNAVQGTTLVSLEQAPPEHLRQLRHAGYQCPLSKVMQNISVQFVWSIFVSHDSWDCVSVTTSTQVFAEVSD